MAYRIEYISEGVGHRYPADPFSCLSSGEYFVESIPYVNPFEFRRPRRVTEALVGILAEQYIRSAKVFHVHEPHVNITAGAAPGELTPERELEKRFTELANKWREETSHLSSTTSIVSSFYYYQIIALGKDVVPFILRELATKGGQWYLALRALTNENPVPPEDSGNVRKMKQAWLSWGEENGLM